MEMPKIRELIRAMTLEEKASLCSGADMWHTKTVERLGVPAHMVADGPHGLRKQEPGQHHVNESVPSVCFPAGCAGAASWNPALLREVGEAIGNECQAEGVQVLLGPAMNIKRSPLCGRNFEYYSEDPLLASRMGRALIEGVQSRGVGACPKHFFANSQEHRRMSTTANADERTLREIYLAAFEEAVREAKPWTLMCSYNRINGVYAAENRTYLTDVLRGEWGFDGYVMSDWGAVNDRAPDLAAGLDLEMPSSGGVNDRRIVQAVREGKLDEAAVDLACERILNIVYRTLERRDETAVFDRARDHALARRAAGECVVLLKNEDILPLAPDKKVVLIGKYAATPRYQGGGSSHINSALITDALSALRAYREVGYARGFDDAEDRVDEALQREAVEAAARADIAVLFVGLPDNFESEGYDRRHMRLPDCQNALIDAVCAVQENVVIVLHNGSPVEMPWAGRVRGILEAYLGGDAVGGAVADVLTGAVNPSGRLPESFPLKLEHNPSYLYYGGEGDVSEYREGVFVGYRYYDKKEMDVLFPFGFGLSYTSFAYENLKLDRDGMADTETLTVTADVVNTGARAGAEVVQLYVAPPAGEILRPARELRGFEKVFLEPGERRTVTFTLAKRAFAYWDMRAHDWVAETGVYRVQLARSSRDIVCEAPVRVRSTAVIPRVYTTDTIIGDLLADPLVREDVLEFANAVGRVYNADALAVAEGEVPKDMNAAMVRYSPLRSLVSFAGGSFEPLEAFLRKINEKVRAACEKAE